jgi:hypothetical protein
MSLNGHVFTAPNGLRGFDTAKKLSRTVAGAFFAQGYRYCVRYVRRDKPHADDLTSAEAKGLLAVGLGLMVVQYVESEESWTPTAEKGQANGATAALEAGEVGVPSGVTLWCDLEGVASKTPSQQTIDYCNEWHSAVAAEGYVPGLYVGWHSGLTPTQLYKSLRFTHYWAAYNLNADEVPIVRGVQMKQSVRRASDAVPGVSFEYQTDRVRSDNLGGRPTLLAAEEWLEDA